MPIISTDLNQIPFTQIANSMLQRLDLTYEAKGLLSELLSRPNDWIVYKSQLERQHTKITKINRIFKELKQLGYLHIYSVRDEKNKYILFRIWYVTMNPLTKKEFEEITKTEEFKKGLSNRIYKINEYKKTLNT